MLYNDVVSIINSLAADGSLDFASRSKRIARLLDNIPETGILEHLDHAGIIPESFAHDSTEEKLFAKYCDALLARSLSLVGMNTNIISERADAADVEARLPGYTVVGDAKAFRLSRTAKNQKDFKVEALNSWRKGSEYALLCSPLYQYPSSNSQIYLQASKYNVTLLSYTHLAFLIRNKPTSPGVLEDLWKVSKTLTPNKQATPYWEAVSSCVCKLSGTEKSKWSEAVRAERALLPKLAKVQIAYWKSEKQRLSGLSHDEAVSALIEALKVDSKIDTIFRNIAN